MNILVSACLLGINCRYNGTGELIEEMKLIKEKHNLIPICPEIYGGLNTPRDCAEIINDRVITVKGKDVTAEYKRGANEILKIAQFYDCKYAILKERSPSCGYGKIYDGSFSKRLIQANGITADLLSKNGVIVFGESDIKGFL